MFNGIRTIYARGLNKGLRSKFCISSWVWQKMPDECRRSQRPKRNEYNNKNEDNSLNTLNEKNQTLMYLFPVKLWLFSLQLSKDQNYTCIHVYIWWLSLLCRSSSPQSAKINRDSTHDSPGRFLETPVTCVTNKIAFLLILAPYTLIWLLKPDTYFVTEKTRATCR